MPIFIYEPDALDKMTCVEGSRWREWQDDDRTGPCTFAAFKQAWEEGCKPLMESGKYSQDELNAHGVTVDGGGAIYGDGGYNRYTVRGDGEIMFIRYQAVSADAIVKAEDVGFRIF